MQWCTYCETEMEITKLKVKRPVPREAKDLGLQDEVTRWQCPKCQSTSDEGLVECDTCKQTGMLTLPSFMQCVKEDTHLRCFLDHVLVMDGERTKYHVCMKCMKCAGCKGDILPGQEIKAISVSDYDREMSEFCGDHTHSIYYLSYHKECHDKQQAHDKVQNSGGGCFIATAAMGSPLAAEVVTLSRFRDEVLATSKAGRAFITVYYALSPYLARFIANRIRLRHVVAEYFVKPLAKSVASTRIDRRRCG